MKPFPQKLHVNLTHMKTAWLPVHPEIAIHIPCSFSLIPPPGFWYSTYLDFIKILSHSGFGMVHIFTYGSLMFQPVWSRVVAGEYRSLPGTVYGVRRMCVKGETYPCLIFTGNDHDFVQGVVYLGVKKTDCDRLDRFEGEYYLRCRIKCKLDDNRLVDADTYFFRKEFHDLIQYHDWDPEQFEALGMSGFLKQYKGFCTG